MFAGAPRMGRIIITITVCGCKSSASGVSLSLPHNFPVELSSAVVDPNFTSLQAAVC